MPFISITRLQIRSWRFMPAFALMAFRTGRQAAKAEGVHSVNFLRDGPRIFWTMTAWDSEAAMRAYMLGDPHRIAMRKLLHWCDEASIVHWVQEESKLPTWLEVHARMQNEGRPSKVNHPSEAHLAYQIAVPRDIERGAVQVK